MVLSITAPVDAGHEDPCAGDVDAQDNMFYWTPLKDTDGCLGYLHNAPGDSEHDDLTDSLGFHVNGTGVAKIHYQLCNIGPGALFYELWFKNDLLTWKRLESYYLLPGTCTTDNPVERHANYKPGTWKFVQYTFADEVPEGQTMAYDLYAQPLWR